MLRTGSSDSKRSMIIKMRIMYSIIINKKWETIKCALFLFLICLYNPIFNLLNQKSSGSDVIYISRILFIALICILLIYTKTVFLKFTNRNWESLILLGISYPQYFALFFLANYNILILQVYFGTMLFHTQKMDIGPAAFVNIIIAVLLYLSGILASLISHSKTLKIGIIILAGVLGILISTKQITFQAIYAVIMSKMATEILFSTNFSSILIKFLLAICLLFALIYKCKNAGIEISFSKKYAGKTNMLGDLIHKLSKKSLFLKNYLWIYKNKDFILWKIFTTIFFSVICYTAASNFSVFFIAYGICLVTSFYFCDIYNFERTLLLHYFMSDYSYAKLFFDLMKSGLFILGDNILVLLLIRCFIHPNSILVLPIIIILILSICIFANSQLFMKYPLTQYHISICFILIKFHIPILNLYLLYKSMREGKANWENLRYENNG